MQGVYSSYIRPGNLEVYCGPMFSFKTQRLIDRVRPIQHIPKADFICIRPKIDVRGSEIRQDPLDFAKWYFVDETKSGEIYKLVKKEHKVIAIDEIQFFDKGILLELETLLRKGKNIAVAGFDLDFKGEPWEIMSLLLPKANFIDKKAAICAYPFCGRDATRTQRLIKRAPAPYDSPLVMLEGTKNIDYEPRCILIILCQENQNLSKIL